MTYLIWAAMAIVVAIVVWVAINRRMNDDDDNPGWGDGR